ncbi:hypothetical protein [Paraliomyxa miuraensis]|uniref:hypothetical protein n=1 Tax=Paraliomyxa miuraensis TaxID=376150 RepID=UPI00225B491E|nr:hypothetical protein [Paraliomyxa miuraensis]MCX4241098.1 hypothetical protein [Paraliomyxa miuraensis]
MIDIAYASPRLAIAMIEDIHIAVHGQDNPSDKDWDAYLDSIRKMWSRHDQVRGLVYTLGGNPSGAQRSQLNKINDGLKPWVSVMVESRIARGAVTALSWFNPRIKAFAPDNLDDAMAHLDITGPHAKRVRTALEHLEKALQDAKD